MNLIDQQDSNNRFRYIRCLKKGADCYTLVCLPVTGDQLAWLHQEFDEVQDTGGILPGYRLYTFE